MTPDHSSKGQTEAGVSPSEPQETYFSRSQAARFLEVPVSTIYHWARTGRLPCILTLGGHMRFAQSDLVAINIRRPPLSRWSQPQPLHDDAQAAAPDRQT